MKVYQALRYIEKRSTRPLIGICVYEALTLAFPSRRFPPITKVCNRYKWAFPMFCGLVGVHVYFFEVADEQSPG